jgi:hypothetical protein
MVKDRDGFLMHIGKHVKVYSYTIGVCFFRRAVVAGGGEAGCSWARLELGVVLVSVTRWSTSLRTPVCFTFAVEGHIQNVNSFPVSLFRSLSLSVRHVLPLFSRAPPSPPRMDGQEKPPGWIRPVSKQWLATTLVCTLPSHPAAPSPLQHKHTTSNTFGATLTQIC